MNFSRSSVNFLANRFLRFSFLSEYILTDHLEVLHQVVLRHQEALPLFHRTCYGEDLLRPSRLHLEELLDILTPEPFLTSDFQVVQDLRDCGDPGGVVRHGQSSFDIPRTGRCAASCGSLRALLLVIESRSPPCLLLPTRRGTPVLRLT